MSENVDALKKLAEGTSTGYFSRATVTTDAMVAAVSALHMHRCQDIHLLVDLTDVQEICRIVQRLCLLNRQRGGNHDFRQVRQ